MTDAFEPRFDYHKAITELREQRRMSREALAAAAGISASYLYEVERGLKRPSADVLVKLATALGMRPSEVLQYIERQAPEPPPAGRAGVRAFIASPAARREWMSQHAQPAPPPAPSPPASPPERSAPGPVLAELLSAARELDDEDLAMLLELARRLRKTLP
jgi:transcriptional regulator with XRE-family HTH domain